jgi:hypothetical protein
MHDKKEEKWKLGCTEVILNEKRKQNTLESNWKISINTISYRAPVQNKSKSPRRKTLRHMHSLLALIGMLATWRFN